MERLLQPVIAEVDEGIREILIPVGGQRSIQDEPKKKMKSGFSSAACGMITLLITSCATSHSVKIKENNNPSWRNIYEGDPALGGIEIWQYPREGNVYERKDVYTGRHPAEIDY